MENSSTECDRPDPSAVRMGVFGGVWVSAGNERCRPSSAKQAALLSLLLANPGVPLSFESAGEALWPTLTAANGRRSLRVHMSSLRKWLRDHCGDAAAAAIETHRLGYRLNIDSEHVDWQVFVSCVERGRRALGERDHAEASAALQTAVDMWAEPFAEVPEPADLESQRMFLRTQLELAQDDLAEVRLTVGGPGDVLAVLTERVCAHPYRERSCEQLMRALYASGRQAAALDVYRGLYRRLRDDLGIEPGPRIRNTQSAILAQQLDAGPPAAACNEAAPASAIAACVVEALAGAVPQRPAAARRSSGTRCVARLVRPRRLARGLGGRL